MIRVSFLTLSLVIACINAREAQASKIRKTCSPQANLFITKSLNYIKSEIEFLKQQDLAPSKIRSNAIKRRMARRLENIAVRCQSHSCKKGGVLGTIGEGLSIRKSQSATIDIKIKIFVIL